MLSQSEGQELTDIMDEHYLGQLIHFPAQEENTFGQILTSLPGQFQEMPELGKEIKNQVKNAA